MRSWPLPLQARFIVFTCVVLIAVAFIFEFVTGHHSLLVEIPLVIFVALAVIGIRDVFQQNHSVHLRAHHNALAIRGVRSQLGD